MADVAAKLHAVEADALDYVVGTCARDAQRIAERGDAHHAPAMGDERIALQPRAGVEHAAVGRRRGQAFDAIALARLVRIAGGGGHPAARAAARPPRPRPGPPA